MNQQFAPPAADIHSDAFKAVMRNVAGATSIITASHAGERAGLTATSLTALSAEPPTVIVCINRGASA
jgi:flavin reductase (DIM6/NTAB) family NADH-FMN oxidoreductase RutF